MMTTKSRRKLILLALSGLVLIAILMLGWSLRLENRLLRGIQEVATRKLSDPYVFVSPKFDSLRDVLDTLWHLTAHGTPSVQKEAGRILGLELFNTYTLIGMFELSEREWSLEVEAFVGRKVALSEAGRLNDREQLMLQRVQAELSSLIGPPLN